MPLVSRLMIRTALLYLALGSLFGALMLGNKGVPIHPMLWVLLPSHIQLVLLGWIVQLAMGVGVWILPRFVTTAAPRAAEQLAWSAYGLLNLGLWLVVAGSLLPFWLSASWLRWLNALGGLAELLAALAFLGHAWPRIKPFADVAVGER
ncbi:MAG TPA: hypothetical protein DEP84_34230 [Chloroflexi bacterium]|nr:hypothetical protein [Chloroflexota bacterium]